jgi:RsiW-degrading membrane proteinase PrsW (M82 family)
MARKGERGKIIPRLRIIILLIAVVFFSLVVVVILNNYFARLTREPPRLVSPFVEETLKMITIISVVVLSREQVRKYQWIAFGMTVGLLFAIPEALGYIVEMGVSPTVRVLPAFGHIAWSGIASIGFIKIPNISLMRGSSGTKFKRAFRSISSVNFLSFLAAAIALHFVWNWRLAGSPIESQFLYIILCFGILFYLTKLSTKK